MRKVLIFLSLASSAFGKESLQSIYNRLDPSSVSQHFAFYELYADTPLGKQALNHAWKLLQAGHESSFVFPQIDIHPLIAFVNRAPGSTPTPLLEESQLAAIEKLSRHLKNRNLKGFNLWNRNDLASMPKEEIDLARALFLAELQEDSPTERQKIRSYEANIDLMALQILARLPENPSPLEKIRAMNDCIFGEMRFRFPPHSLWAKDIDVYTLLPAVLDSRRGVCLGVSILYLCLAQRLDLSLEVITPPGHIYVRYVDPVTSEILNIETTARGIDVPSEAYLGIETRSLQKRNIKEVVGLAFMNQAAVFWHRNAFDSAIRLYEQARTFLPNDYLLQMFLGFNYLIAGQTKEGIQLLKKNEGIIPDEAISGDTISEDYLAGKVDAEGIQAVFAEVDENRSSILEKQKKLVETVSRCPRFRQGWLHLAITYLQLGRDKEALPVLEHYIDLHPKDPTANYYLSAIHFQRLHFNAAWNYLRQAEAIVHARNHFPRALKNLRKALHAACPETKQ